MMRHTHFYDSSGFGVHRFDVMIPVGLYNQKYIAFLDGSATFDRLCKIAAIRFGALVGHGRHFAPPIYHHDTQQIIDMDLIMPFQFSGKAKRKRTDIEAKLMGKSSR